MNFPQQPEKRKKKMNLHSIKKIAGMAICALCATSFAQLGEISTDEPASSPKADVRVRRALESAGVKYAIDKDGDYKVTWTLEEGRTHVVFVNSNTTRLGTMELRKVWAVSFVADEVSANNMRALLELNAKYKVGNWSLSKQNGGYIATFNVTVAANCAAQALRTFTQVVASTADEIENTVTRADRF